MRLVGRGDRHGVSYEVGFTLALPWARDPSVVRTVAARKCEELIRHVAREEARTPLDVTARMRSKVAGPFGIAPDKPDDPQPLDDPHVVAWGWHMILESRGEEV